MGLRIGILIHRTPGVQRAIAGAVPLPTVGMVLSCLWPTRPPVEECPTERIHAVEKNHVGHGRQRDQVGAPSPKHDERQEHNQPEGDEQQDTFSRQDKTLNYEDQEHRQVQSDPEDPRRPQEPV